MGRKHDPLIFYNQKFNYYHYGGGASACEKVGFDVEKYDFVFSKSVVEIRRKAEKVSFDGCKAECREGMRDSLQGFWKEKARVKEKGVNC